MALPEVNDINGVTLTPHLNGKVLFVMNVASKCGLTKAGYKLFKKVIEKFDSDKFAAVGVPCNAFANEEPGTAAEVCAFSAAHAPGVYSTEKTSVSGDDTHPLIALAKSKFPAEITWNFDGRYIFDKSGIPVARFTHESSDDEIVAEIAKHI